MDEEANVALEQHGEAPSEKMIPQSQLNEIVKREKLRAAEIARREAETEFRSKDGNSNTPQTLDIDGLKESLRKDVYDQFMGDIEKHHAEMERSNQEKHLKGIVDQYYIKMGKGSELFSDFNEIMADFEPEAFPNTVLLVAQMENAPEIMYELANNPGKLQEINGLAKDSPKMAQRQLSRLAESIGKNLEAKKGAVSAPQPLSRLKSSSVGADTGKMSMRDLKKAAYLRA